MYDLSRGKVLDRIAYLHGLKRKKILFPRETNEDFEKRILKFITGSEERKMGKYFEIKPDCALYRDYFAHKEDEPKIINAFKEVCEKFGIETSDFYPKKNMLCIVPTEKDKKRFENMMKKTSFGEFKKNSEPSKTWCELVKDIEHFEKPKVIFYFRMSGRRWRTRMFHVGAKLYCSIETDGEVFPNDFAIEINESEFYQLREENEIEEV